MWPGLERRMRAWFSTAVTEHDFDLAESIARLLAHVRAHRGISDAVRVLFDELEMAERRHRRRADPIEEIRAAVDDLTTLLAMDERPGDCGERLEVYRLFPSERSSSETKTASLAPSA